MGESGSRPIKVMHVIARMNVGGPAVEIAELMRGLDPQQISQRLVTGHCDDDEADYLETQAIDISATRINGLGRSVKFTDDAFVLARLTELIRSSRPDIVHTHTAKAGVLGRLAAKASGTGTKIVHTYHGHLLHGYFGPTKTKAVIQVERQLARFTDRIITVGEKVKTDLLDARIGEYEQYVVIRSGVQLGPLPDKETTRRELGLPEGTMIVSMIGRLTQIKRPDRFADVAEIIKGKGLNVHFLVAGGGDLEQDLRDRVEGSQLPVDLLGWRSDLERILAATDVLVLTSDNEGTPLSVIQAGLASVPTVAICAGSIPEMIENGVTGFLCGPSAIDVAKAIETLNANRQLILALGGQSRVLMESRFPPDRFLNHHADVYEFECGKRR